LGRSSGHSSESKSIDARQLLSLFVGHYTAHIAAHHLEPNFALENYWLPLLEGGWHQAWEAYEGAWNGFLSDLQQVIQALRQYNQACYDRGERTAMKLAAEVRCAL
jgi:hypothetical protein